MIKMRKLKPYLPLYLMMIPCAAYLIVNNYMPMVGIISAFKSFKVSEGIFGSPWVGLKNFEYLFRSSDVATIVRNTLLYNGAFIIVNNVVGIVLAILITGIKSDRMKKWYQSSVLLPFTMSMVVISYVVFAFLSQQNGMLNNSLFKNNPVEWYNDPTWWPLILIVVNCWKYVGYGTLIYIAGISGIDRSLYEAASIDGAGKWKQIRSITLPALVPSIVTLFLLSIGRICYSDFGLFYLVPQNSGPLFDVTATIDTYVYGALMSPGGIGRSAATGLLQAVVGFVLVLLANAVVRRLSSKDAIF
ncbi:ABC transporter permease [Cohnella rhizosphaerae]|uniref:ABC transporter permease subunit n=1 Tax=Cohnella rhizosphaerae TaxID=1457232 RepID=A0A9X4QS10_9BACL|nr:ABC transporter permease subunit [Cohnella rhizosphaerae]MDG0808843.1 ABC transporter permease subunit [Cohnella rhizosphaerae]